MHRPAILAHPCHGPRAIVDNIAWYNGSRLHCTLDYLTPAEYETTIHQDQNQLAEMAPAHTIEDPTEAAYRRGDMLAKRAKMMES